MQITLDTNALSTVDLAVLALLVKNAPAVEPVSLRAEITEARAAIDGVRTQAGELGNRLMREAAEREAAEKAERETVPVEEPEPQPKKPRTPRKPKPAPSVPVEEPAEEPVPDARPVADEAPATPAPEAAVEPEEDTDPEEHKAVLSEAIAKATELQASKKVPLLKEALAHSGGPRVSRLTTQQARLFLDFLAEQEG